jgi:2,3-bisphosphoglycerate-independent phosphoglycerate mutase
MSLSGANLITVSDDKIADYSAGHIISKEAATLIKAINEGLGSDRFQFFLGSVTATSCLQARRPGTNG